jgi:hypothetical protein
VIGKINPVILNDPDEDYVERDEEEEVEQEGILSRESTPSSKFLTPETSSSEKSSGERPNSISSSKSRVEVMKDKLRSLTPKALKWPSGPRQSDSESPDQLTEPRQSPVGIRHNVSVYDDVTMGDNVSVAKEPKASSGNRWWSPKRLTTPAGDPMGNHGKNTPRTTLTATRRPGLRSSFRARSPSFTEHRRRHFWQTPPHDDNDQSMMDYQETQPSLEEMELSRQATPPRLMKRLFDRLTPKSTTATRAQEARLKQHRQGDVLPEGSILDKENPFSVYESKSRANVRFGLRRKIKKPTWFQAGEGIGRRRGRIELSDPNQPGSKLKIQSLPLQLGEQLPTVAKMPTLRTARAELRPSPLS